MKFVILYLHLKKYEPLNLFIFPLANTQYIEIYSTTYKQVVAGPKIQINHYHKCL